MILTCAPHTFGRHILESMKVFVAILVSAIYMQAQTIAVTIDDLPVVTTQRTIEARRDITKRLRSYGRTISSKH